MMFTSTILALGSLAVVKAQEMPTNYANPLLAKVLVYTYCDGFRHDSIPTAIAQVQKWAPYYNVSIEATEDQSKITSEYLSQFDTLMFIHSTGNIFSTAGQTAFADYLSKGGNFAAIHAASAAYMPKAWAPWTETLGATFDHHPNRQTATFVKELTGHPATDAQPDRWTFDEEVYSFTTDPRKLGAKLLWSVDDSSYKEDDPVTAQGTPHPIAWCQDYSAGSTPQTGGSGPGIGGRSFYSSLGHNNSTWMDPAFMKHVMGGLTWTFSSNTTRVAQGLYNGAEPTIHTGATNNATSAVVNLWAPVLGSNQTAPAPPAPPVSPSSSASTPEASSSSSGSTTSTSSNTSGAIVGVSAPTAFLTVAIAALGAVFSSL